MADSPEKLNIRVAIVVTGVGVLAIAFGAGLAGYERRSTWSSVLMDVGVAISLVAVLFVLERRLVSRSAERAATAAKEAVQAVAESIDRRLVRLEELRDAQQQARAERQGQAGEASRVVHSVELDANKVGTLLLAALKDHLITDEWGVKFRTSSDPDCPLLHVLVLDVGIERMLFLDFVPISGPVHLIEQTPVPAPTETMVLWGDESAATIASKLDDALVKMNQPVDKFDFAFALEHVAKSIDVMRAARNSPAGSPLRLEGQLVTLINESWAHTDWGLESVNTDERYELQYATWISYGARSSDPRHPDRLLIPPEDQAATTPELSEALTWLSQRESVTIGPPPAPPKAPPTLGSR